MNRETTNENFKMLYDELSVENKTLIDICVQIVYENLLKSIKEEQAEKTDSCEDVPPAPALLELTENFLTQED